MENGKMENGKTEKRKNGKTEKRFVGLVRRHPVRLIGSVYSDVKPLHRPPMLGPIYIGGRKIDNTIIAQRRQMMTLKSRY
jgi:hypothetical protein